MAPVSHWFEAVPEEKRFPSLEGNLSVDIVVIGGGIAGLMTAYLLAKEGVRVALVEQGFIGSGDSGYTTAFISRFLDNAAATKKTWPAGEETLNLIERIVQDEKIDCDFRRIDSAYFTRSNRDGLAKEFEIISSCDPLMRFTEGDDASALCGFEVAAAILKKDEGQFHIRKFLLGLAEAIQKPGGVIFEKMPVSAIEEEGCLVRCKTGSIKTERVVVATGMPMRMFSEITKLLTPFLTFVVGASFPEKKPFGEHLFWDDEDPYHYFRWVDDTELILGGVDRAMKGPKPAENPHEILEEFLSGISKEKSTRVHAWQGSIFATEDSLPYYGTHPVYGERIFFATGFGGNGMTFGSLAGKVISDTIIGRASDFTTMFSFSRK
jgi:glycine/D-amino acid oxidase-like deaminating enzyme